jgi:hypothetical protein
MQVRTSSVNPVKSKGYPPAASTTRLSAAGKQGLRSRDSRFRASLLAAYLAKTLWRPIISSSPLLFLSGATPLALADHGKSRQEQREKGTNYDHAIHTQGLRGFTLCAGQISAGARPDSVPSLYDLSRVRLQEQGSRAVTMCGTTKVPAHRRCCRRDACVAASRNTGLVRGRSGWVGFIGLCMGHVGKRCEYALFTNSRARLCRGRRWISSR